MRVAFLTRDSVSEGNLRKHMFGEQTRKWRQKYVNSEENVRTASNILVIGIITIAIQNFHSLIVKF